MAELEEKEKEKKRIASKFHSVKNFNDSPFEFPSNITLFGVATELRDILVADEESVLYFV